LDFSLFDLLDDFYFLLDKEGGIIEANERVYDRLGYDREHLKEIDAILSPESILQMEHSLIRCNTGQMRTEIECRVKNASGSATYECLALFNCIQKDRVLLQIKDITQQRKDRLNLTRFKYIADHTMNALQITDLTGKMIYVNPAFAAESGFDQEELIGLNPKVFGSGKHSEKHWENM